MMRISTRIPEGADPGEYAWFVKNAIQGFAAGCYPMFLRWRLPPLYTSGVRWQLEPGHGSGNEDFALPLVTYQRRVGDCDDLVIWRLCELWQAARFRPENILHLLGNGEAASCRAIWEGPQLHVLVRLPNRETEDPSEKLGG